jgi:hypothetical protein
MKKYLFIVIIQVLIYLNGQPVFGQYTPVEISADQPIPMATWPAWASSGVGGPNNGNFLFWTEITVWKGYGGPVAFTVLLYNGTNGTFNPNLMNLTTNFKNIPGDVGYSQLSPSFNQLSGNSYSFENGGSYFITAECTGFGYTVSTGQLYTVYTESAGTLAQSATDICNGGNINGTNGSPVITALTDVDPATEPSGYSPSIQWLLNGNVFATGDAVPTDFPNFTSSAYTVQKVITALPGVCPEEKSNILTFNVYNPLTSGTISPALANQAICSNGIPNTLVCSSPQGGSGNFSYQWYWSSEFDIMGNNPKLWGSNSLTLTPTIIQGTPPASTYYQLTTTDNNCGGNGGTATVTSNVASLLLDAPLSGGHYIATSSAYCSGKIPEPVTCSPVQGGSGVISGYQWYSSSDTLSNSTELPGAVNAEYTFTSTPPYGNTYYQRITYDAACGEIKSFWATVNILKPVTAGSIGSSQTICDNAAYGPDPLTANVPAYGSGNFTYQWESYTGNNSWTPVIGATGQAGYNIPFPFTVTTNYRQVQTDATCGTVVYSNSVTITSDGALNTGTACTSTPAITSGGNGQLDYGCSYNAPSGGSGNFSYQWEYSTGGSGYSPCTGTGNNNTAFAPKDILQTTSYELQVTDNICKNVLTTQPVTISVQLQPGQLTADQTVCNGTIPQAMYCMPPSGGSGNAQLQWQNSTDGSNFFDLPGITADSYTPSTPLTVNTWYRVMITDGTIAYTNTIKITVLPVVTAGRIGYAQTICNNTSPVELGFTTNPSGGSGSYSYQWENSPDDLSTDFQPSTGEGNNTATFVPDPLSANTYYRCQVTDNTCNMGTYLNVFSGSIKITVQDQLSEGTETSQPQTICYNGIPSAMSVSAPSGGNGANSYTYNWQSSADNFSFSDILSATSTTYTPANELTTTTYYRRSVTSGSCGTAYSPSITVTVLPELSPAQITGEQTICYGTAPSQPVSVTVAPTGGNGNYTYQWMQSSNAGITWSPVPGGVQSSYQPGSLNATASYEITVTSGTCGTATSNQQTITVPGPLEEATITEAQDICYNSTPRLLTGPDATGGDNTYTYQWQSGNDNHTWINISGAIQESYQPGNLLTDTFYRRSVTSQLCGSAYSNSLKITVGTPVNAGTISSSGNICSGNTPSPLTGTNPAGGNGVYSYVWQNSPDSVVFNNIVNGTASMYAPGALTATAYYRRIVNTSCGSDTTNVTGIHVLSSLEPGTVVAPQSLCYGSVPTKLSGSPPAGGNSAYTFQWQWSDDDNIFVDVDSLGTSSSYIPPPATADVYYRRKAFSSSCTPAASNSIFISVKPAVNPDTITNNQTICYNSQPLQLTGGDASGGMGNYLYQWYTRNVNDTAWYYIPGETSLNYQPGMLINTSYYKRVTTSGNCGSAASNIITVNVLSKVKPAVISGSQTICYNSIPGVLSDSILPAGGSGTFSYQWQKSPDRNIWNNIPDSYSAAYLPGLLTSDEYYRVVSANVCDTVTSNIVTVKVMPSLSGGQITGRQCICYNMTPSTLYGSAAMGEDGIYNYQWQSSNDSLSWNDLFFNGTGLNYLPDSLQVTTWYRRIATSGACNTESPSNIICVTVSPAEIPGNIQANQSICYNAKPETIKGIPAGGGTGSPVYSWESSQDGIKWTQIYFFGDSINYSPDNLTDTTAFRRKVSMPGCNDLYTNSIIITVNPEIPCPVVNTDSTYCINSMVTLSESSASKNTMLWYNAKNELINQGQTYTIDTFKNYTQIFIRALQSSDNCLSDSVQLLLKPDLVHAAFSVTDADTQVIIGSGVNFKNESAGAVSYVWQFYDGDPSFEVNPWHFYNAVGKYSVQLVAASKDNCSDTAFNRDLIDAVLSPGMNNNTDISTAQENTVTVYPNPVSDYLTVKSGSDATEQITVYDIQGKVVINREITGTDITTVNVNFLPEGLYTLKIKTSSNLLIFKIIKL